MRRLTFISSRVDATRLCTKLGVGEWRQIKDNLLSDWDTLQLRVKASRMMGTQSLARYPGWKGNRAAVDREYARNKTLGESCGCWKSGTLVEVRVRGG